MKTNSILLMAMLSLSLAFMGCKNKAQKSGGASDGIEDVKWELTTLRGKQINPGSENIRPFLQFNSSSKTLTGSNSCNRINTSYTLKEGNRIEVEKIAGTLMACPNMDLADQFMEVLEMMDNYTVNDGVLSLNKARMAPLAQFKIASE